MKTKIITRLTCCFLVLSLLFTGVFFPSFKKEAYALSYDDNFESYLSGNCISDTYIEEVDQILVEKYQDYVYYDSHYIEMEMTEIDEKYGEIIYDYTIDAMNYVDDEADLFDIAAIRMIRRNIRVMNELVSEDCGEITDDGEFIFYAGDEYVEQWRAWGFRLRWNKFSVNFDSDFAILFSIVFLVPAIAVEFGSLADTVQGIKTDDDLISYVVMEAFYFLPIEIASQVVAFFSSDILSYLVSIGGWAVDILSSSNVAWKVFEIVYGILMPSISDCVIVLYYALAEYRGVELKLCWIPTWWDKWGLSIKTI